MAQWHSHSEMGLRSLSSAHQQGHSTRNPDSFFFIPLYNNLLLHQHFYLKACCQQVLILSLWLLGYKFPGEGSQSPHIYKAPEASPVQGGKAVCPGWKVVLVGAHEPLQSPVHCSWRVCSLTCPAVLCWRAHASVFPATGSISVRLSGLLWRSTLSSWSGTRGLVQRCSK